MNEQDKATPAEKAALGAAVERMTPFEREAHSLRRHVKAVALDVKHLVEDVKRGLHLPNNEAGAAQAQLEDRGEVIANIMLAYRHLEDASMRLGKAIQAHNGGTSVYDRESTVGA
jgi:hypothetical protein